MNKTGQTEPMKIYKFMSVDGLNWEVFPTPARYDDNGVVTHVDLDCRGSLSMGVTISLYESDIAAADLSEEGVRAFVEVEMLKLGDWHLGTA